MDHPTETQLQSLHDEELDPDDACQVRAHVTACAWYAARSDDWRRLRLAVRQTMPGLGAFSSDGEFWGRLAGRLERRERREPVWPWVPLVPPVVLGAMGSLAQAVLSISVILYVLMGLNIIAPGVAISRGLDTLVRSSLLESTVYSWMGWTGDGVARALLQPWNGMGYDGQHAMLWLVMLTVLGLILTLVLVLSLSWAVFWARPYAKASRRR
jgi:hypothetical protein